MAIQAQAESTLFPLFTYLGWSFLPNIATNTLQSFYYRLTLPAGTPPPQQGTALYARDHRRIRVVVLSLYLLYTLAQSLYDVKLAGDFYTLLTVSPYTTTDKEIKSRLRRLAAKYHPDKLSSNSDSSTNQNESLFLHLRLASETLTTPSHKYAYTHFGPQILTHLPRPEDFTTQTTRQISLQTADLVILALRQKIPSYIATLVWVFILNTFFLPRHANAGKFWRYWIITLSFVLEFYLLTHEIPALPSSLETGLHYLRTYTGWGAAILPSHLLPFQILEITSRLAMSLNIFISQVSGLFQGPQVISGSGDVEAEKRALVGWMGQLGNNLSMLSSGAGRLDQEATGLLELQFSPFKGQIGHVRELRRGMKEGMVLGGVRGHPEVQDAVKRVVERRNNANRQRHLSQRDGIDVVDLLNSDEQFT